MTESLRHFSQSLVPILRAKDNENRRLKRLISERCGIEDEDDIFDARQPKRRNINPRHFQ